MMLIKNDHTKKLTLENSSLKGKIKRKKFFKTVGISIVGFAVMKSLPFYPILKKEKIENRKIKVSINPLAVQRKKDKKYV